MLALTFLKTSTLSAGETITPLMSHVLATVHGKQVLMYAVNLPPGFSNLIHRCNRRNKEEHGMYLRSGGLSSVVLRLGLGLSFLSAVADRFGLWGAFGQPNVAWGNFSRFLRYTHTLLWFLPAGLIPPLGAIATAAEILFGLLLLIGWRTRIAARLSGLLLLVFAMAMTFALGVKAPLDFSVLTGVGGSFLLANCESFPFSVDEILFRRTHLEKER